MIYVMVSSAESVQIDAAMADEISIQYDISSLDEALYQRAWEGDFKKSIGSTYAANQEYLLPTLVTDSEASSSFGISEISDSDKVEWDIDAIESEMDDFMDAAVDTSERGVTPDIFPKCGEYLLRTPRVTIDVTSQLSVTPKDLILAKNYGTNDRMLRYKRIKNIYSWMSSMLSSMEASHQLFVTDKGFVYVVPMRSDQRSASLVPDCSQRTSTKISPVRNIS
jgi:hypothetical protein